MCYITIYFIVYDVSSRQSFEGLEIWLNELDTYATKKDLIKMLVANKIDKVRRERVCVCVCGRGGEGRFT